jgi:hypothetical protein
MNNQIQVGEIAQFVNKAAKFGAASGVTVAVELEDGKVMTQRWGAVEATVEATSETIRDAWAKIATDEWTKFQSMAAEYGVHSMTRPAMIDKLTDMGVMPGDDPSDTEQSVFAAPRTGGMTSSKAFAVAED